MARLPYADLEQAAVRPLVDRIVAERGSVLHLYQMLLHSPPLAQGWLAFLTAVRHQLDLPGDLRELVIMRIAHLNGAPYEAEQHAPIALREGLSPAHLEAVAADDAGGHPACTPLQRQVLAYCDDMTRQVQVDERLVAGLREALGERQLVELTATIGAYNMVSRFLEALQIHSHDAR